jgi:Mn2+/Fe2+ NRAMP family transporter
VVAFSIVLAAAVALAGVSPIRLLFWASVAGGLGTPIGLAFLMLIGSERSLMGGDAISGRLKLAGWTVAAIIATVSVIYLVDQV